MKCGVGNIILQQAGLSVKLRLFKNICVINKKHVHVIKKLIPEK